MTALPWTCRRRTSRASLACARVLVVLAVGAVVVGCAPAGRGADGASRGTPGSPRPLGPPQVLEDPAGALTLADVTAPPHAAEFAQGDRDVLNRGQTSSAFWLRLAVGPTSVPLVLEVDNPTLSTVSVYRIDAQGRLAVTHTGQALPLATRDLDHPSFLFHVAPSPSTTVYVRVTSRSPVRVPLRLWRLDDFQAADRLMSLRSGLFYGAMVLAAAFQLMLAAAARDRSYLAFVAAVLAGSVMLLGMDGLGPYYLWPDLTAWSPEITTASGVLTILGLLAFTAHFLSLRAREPRAHRLLWAVGIAMVATGLLIPRTLPYQATAAFALVVSFAVGVHSWRRGHAPARRFVLAWAVLAIGIVTGQFVLAGLDGPAGLRADQLYRLAALPAVAVFSVSLADRLWMLRRAAEAAEAALRRQEQTQVEVARGIVGTTGDEVFSTLVRHLARALEADMAFVAEIDEAGERARTVARWADGSPAGNFDYALAYTPCQGVLAGGVCGFADDVQQRFPRDADLATLGVHGYVGTPLRNSAGRAIGLLVCLYRRRVPDLPAAMRTLQLFAGRAAAELERRRAERALAEREALLSALLENSPAVIYVKDPDGRYLLVNRQFEETLRLSRDRVLGRTDRELWGAAVADGIRAHDLEALGSDTPRQFEESGDGGTFLSTKAALRDGDGRPWATIGVSTDITEFKQLQAQLRAAQRMEAFGQLAGGLAHDFNNLLTAILGYVGLCESQAPPGTALAHDLAEARHATERAARITGHLLAFARRQPAAPQEVDLNEVIRGIERLLRQAAGANVTVHFALHREPVGVRVDPVQFEQVILNLVLNARDAMPEGGTIRVETDLVSRPDEAVADGTCAAGPCARLRVTDTGTGIDPAHLPRLFEPFFTTKPAGRGTGLGLSMCHGIVRQAGGMITADSQPGRGATFTVLVPEARPLSQVAVSRDTLRTVGGSETILLADDDEPIRRLAARVLRSRGYQVLLAEDGTTALRQANDHEGAIDLLLTDVSMPGMNGRELALALRSMRPGISVIYMSGYGEEAIADDGLVIDGSPYLAKPFAVEQLAGTVREVLDGRHVPAMPEDEAAS